MAHPQTHPTPPFWVRVLRAVWPGRRAADERRRIERLLVDGEALEARDAAAALASDGRDDSDAAYLLGRAYRALDDPSREAEAYAVALARRPDHARAAAAALKLRAERHRPVMAAWRLYEAGRYAEARAEFAAAQERVAVGPDAAALTAETWRGRGWSSAALGEPDAAAEAFAAATRADPANASGFLGLGIARFRRGELDAAEASLHEALRLKPAYADAEAFLGWCAYARGDVAAAERRFEAATVLHPLAADPRYGLAWCAVRRRDPDAAARLFAAAAERGAAHPSRADLAALAASDPRYAPALAAVDAARPDARAVAAGSPEAPPDMRAAERLADALEALIRGDAPRSLAAIAGMDDPRARILRGRTFAALGRMDEALAEYRAAAAAHPAHPAPALEAARSLLAAGRAAEALAALEPWIERNLDDPDVYSCAAAAAAATGDAERAARFRARSAAA